MAEPMSDERLAEIRKRATDPHDEAGHRITRHRDVPALLAEVERLRAEVEELRAEVKRLRVALGVEVRRRAEPTTSSGAPDSTVRAWARERGIPVNPKGRVAADVRSAFEAAWRAEQEKGQADE